MDKITAFLEDTRNTSRLSRDQKKNLQDILESIQGDRRQLSNFREEAFEVARKQLPSEHHLVINWLEMLIKPLMGATTLPKQDHNDAWFSPGDTCLEQIRHCLDAAKKKIDICVFTITDDRIVERILAAQRRGIKVRIISDNDKAFDPGSDIHRMHRAGLRVRIDESEKHMHHKFAIFDDDCLLTGSYNWTRSAARVNEENVVRIYDAHVVEAFCEEFEKLWAEMEPLS